MENQEVYTFDSSDGHSVIHCRKWLPEGDGIAVVQLVHGMVEYIERYDEFARFLASKGYIVVGHDHIGHGHCLYSCSFSVFTIISHHHRFVLLFKVRLYGDIEDVWNVVS